MYKSILQAGVLLILTLHRSWASWEFAVTTNSKISFYDEHWNQVTSSAHQFDKLSAITFDETEEILYFNDNMHNNGSIFSLKIPRSTEDNHIIEGIVERTKNEYVTSMAYDPVNRALYWTDRTNKKIYTASLDLEKNVVTTRVLFDFKGEEVLPDGLAIDICRRKLYWTNSNFKNASIERSNLDGSQREIVVNNDLYMPHGIVVDQLEDRLYWVVDRQGIHFTVESAQLDGSDRQVVVQGLSNVPFSLAVTNDAIFWTDLINNAIWAHSKKPIHSANPSIAGDITEQPPADPEQEQPHEILNFSEKPRGIVARSRFLTTMQHDEHCAAIVSKLKARILKPRTTSNPINEEIAKLHRASCLNGGEYVLQSDMCICRMGYKGAHCETSECHNFCVHGSCSMSSLGYPQCDCQKGFRGQRCESSKCIDYCLNGGSCKIDDNGEASCECRNNFGGPRCDHNSTEICSLYCRVLQHEPDVYVPFGCHDICQELSQQQNEDGSVNYLLPQYKHLEVCKSTSVWSGTVIIVLVCGVVAALACVVLIVTGVRRLYKPARPRVKKTFVVRKAATSSADTPLTNRPLTTEQCEITIENCCNMNICESPCFDPKLMSQTLSRDTASTKEDKKILINSMEDDLY